MNQTKPILSSTTVWFGLVQAVFGAVGLVTGWMDASAATTLIITGVGTVGLRFKTTQPII